MKKLTYRNNWESDEYFVGKAQVKTLERVKINEAEFDVITRRISVSYSDHGNPCSAVSNHFFIVGMVNGVWFERDLNTIVRKDGLTVTPLIWS